ncbi:MAG TPA: NAD(P)H-binding protein [Burkholderiaceae bacterium]
MNPAAPPPRTALVAGATGLVGRALLALLEASDAYAGVHVLVRRPVTGIEANPKVAFHTVDFAHLPHPFPTADDVYIALGTTIKVAGSQEAFRHVDLDYVVNTARAARRAGARRLAVVSALGADARSRVFYNRVKGEMQQDIVELGYESVVIAQPSLLTGDRANLGQPTRSGEVWATRLLSPVMEWVPKGIRPIAANVVAEALIDATLAGAPGVHLLSSAQMQAHHRQR